MGKFIDRTGYRYGKLTVIALAGQRKDKKLWLCKCDCGGEVLVSGSDLQTGNTQSCGSSIDKTKHGMSRDPIYRRWWNMMHRCTYGKGLHAKYYKDITVCERWRHFPNFAEDMLKSFLEHVSIHGLRNTTLERKDYLGNYEPSNCEWATYRQQAKNRRSTRLVTFDGRTQSVIEWAREKGIHQGTIAQRLDRKWSVEKALTTPARKMSKH